MSPRAGWRRRVALPVFLLTATAVVAPLPPPAAWGQEEEYVIGADDVLQIQVLDNKDLDQVLPVRPDGKISFPLAGEVHASGLTVSEFSALLTQKLAKSVKNPTVSVIVKEVRSLRVYFVGRVAKPGVYPIKAGTSLLQALTLAGGPVDGADLSSSYVVRGEQRIFVDLRRLVQDADLSQNVPLHRDDTIVVPEMTAGANPQEVLERRIYVLGKVQKPGMYTTRHDIPVLNAIFLAGGLVEPAADLAGAFVIRGKDRIPIDLRRLIQKGDLSQNVMIRNEDTIVVPDGGEMQNSVFIMGEVAKPGFYPRADALTLMQLVSVAGGFTKFAAPGRITVIREDRSNGTSGTRQKSRIKVNANAIQRNPRANPDPSLEPGDVVVVPQTLF